MNPFVAPQTDPKPSPWNWLGARPGLIVFLLTLALGLGAVCWRANSRAKAARQFARIEVRARAASVQGQLRHAVAALQVLGALARQSGGAIPKFQEVGAGLRAAWPDLATLELQPNGVVSEIVPRAGYERAVGFNVLKDPAQAASARAAVQGRAATVAGPLRLYRGEPGIVMRTPIFQRARDGREAFWGFVAVSMRLTEPLARARTEELQQAMQQEFGARDFKAGPTPAPPGGWIDRRKAALECLGVLVLAGLLWLLMRLLKSGQSLEAALADANRRLASLGAERKQAQEDWRGAKEAAAAAQTQLKETRAALQQAEFRSLECQERLERSERANQETSQALRARLKQAELNAHELQETVGQGPAEPTAAESPLLAPAQPEGPGTATNTSDNRPPKPASRLPAERKPPGGSTEEKPTPARPARALPPVNPAQLRKAVNQILPLLAGQDPGARDCLADNRPIFQSAFAPEAYAEFEQCIKKRDFDSAQEQLKKAVKKHGIM
jgi:hypothetical protein